MLCKHAGTFVRRGVLHAMQAARDEIFADRAPARRRFNHTEPHAQLFAIVVGVEANHPEHRPVSHGAFPPHTFDVGIDDQIRIRFAAEREFPSRGEAVSSVFVMAETPTRACRIAFLRRC